MSDLGAVSRKLVAVFAADVEGYSRLMGIDEVGTLKGLTQCRAILDKCIADHRGRIANTAGDSVLAEFGSAVDAVQCAIEAQTALAEANGGVPSDKQINFRIGVHIGDVMVRAGDLFGDGVNVAARLQTLSKSGAVCISGATYDQVRKLLPFAFLDLGNQEVKNIREPIRAYEWKPSREAREALPLPDVTPILLDKPSIAVLPFQNMSGDPEQEYFADGVAEDVLTTLSKIQELMVIARNSSFVFKGQNRDVREIGRILGVRYILEGSVRKAGNRARLTAQLIDSGNGSHLWADRFDGDLDDVFDFQDRITQEIVAALEVKLTQGEQARVWRKRSGSTLVYDAYMRGRNLYLNFAKQTHAEARIHLEQALLIAPAFTPALYQLGLVLTDQARFRWVRDQEATFNEALRCAEQALAVDPGSGEAYLVIGYVAVFQRRHDDAVAAGEQAISLSPSGHDAFHMAGMFHGYAGNFKKAIHYEERARQLSPLNRNEAMVDEARARFHLGDLVAAQEIASRVLAEKPQWLTACTVLAAALWSLDRKEEARATVRRIRVTHPKLTVSRWAEGYPYRDPADLEALLEPLRLAGLPD